MFTLLRMIILILYPCAAFFRRKVLPEMRIKQQYPLSESFRESAAAVCPQASNVIIKTNNDMTAGLYQPAYTQKSLLRIIGMVQNTIGDDDIHGGRSDTRHK